MKTLRFIEPSTPEWDAAWRGLADLGWLVPGNGPNCPACNPRSGECWQHMGALDERDFIVHQFRHRDYPGTLEHCEPETKDTVLAMNGRVYVNVLIPRKEQP